MFTHTKHHQLSVLLTLMMALALVLSPVVTVTHAEPNVEVGWNYVSADQPTGQPVINVSWETNYEDDVNDFAVYRVNLGSASGNPTCNEYTSFTGEVLIGTTPALGAFETYEVVDDGSSPHQLVSGNVYCYRVFGRDSNLNLSDPGGPAGETYYYGGLGIFLAEFFAAQGEDPWTDHILVTWETATELDNVGFNLYRATSPNGTYTKLNQYLIPSQSLGNPSGFVYTYEDHANLAPNTTYYYKLEDKDVYGVYTMHGPTEGAFFTNPWAVELEYFTATVDGNTVLVEWETVDEYHTVSFKIWRVSTDSWSEEDPVVVETVEAFCYGSHCGNNYELKDEVDAGHYLYWLVDVDENDVPTNHPPIAVTVYGG